MKVIIQLHDQYILERKWHSYSFIGLLIYSSIHFKLLFNTYEKPDTFLSIQCWTKQQRSCPHGTHICWEEKWQWINVIKCYGEQGKWQRDNGCFTQGIRKVFSEEVTSVQRAEWREKWNWWQNKWVTRRHQQVSIVF